MKRLVNELLEYSPREKIIFKLINRSGDAIWFIENRDNEYELIFPFKYSFRIGYDVDKTIIFIDPSGGPMINLGDKELIKGEEIVGIYTENEKIIIRTKNII